MGANLIDQLRGAFPALDAIPTDCVVTGGPVRDALLGRVPVDLDLACRDAAASARAFHKAAGGTHVTLGTRVQTHRVIINGTIYDFAPMKDGDLISDLGRRDFTINAIGLRLDGQVVDPFGGVAALEHQTIRMVDRANLVEDPLRVLRAVRLAAELGFDIEEATADACRATTLDQVATERITQELRLIFAAPHPEIAARSMRALELDHSILGFGLRSADLEAWCRVSSVAKEDDRPVAVLVVLLIDRARERDSLLENLTWTRTEAGLVRDALSVAASPSDRQLVVAAERGRDATAVAEAALRARDETMAAERLREILARVPSPFEIAPLLDGNEIAAITGADGPRIGTLKSALWEAQILGTVTTTEEARNLVAGQASPERDEPAD